MRGCDTYFGGDDDSYTVFNDGLLAIILFEWRACCQATYIRFFVSF